MAAAGRIKEVGKSENRNIEPKHTKKAFSKKYQDHQQPLLLIQKGI